MPLLPSVEVELSCQSSRFTPLLMLSHPSLHTDNDHNINLRGQEIRKGINTLFVLFVLVLRCCCDMMATMSQNCTVTAEGTEFFQL